MELLSTSIYLTGSKRACFLKVRNLREFALKKSWTTAQRIKRDISEIYTWNANMPGCVCKEISITQRSCTTLLFIYLGFSASTTLYLCKDSVGARHTASTLSSKALQLLSSLLHCYHWGIPFTPELDLSNPAFFIHKSLLLITTFWIIFSDCG